MIDLVTGLAWYDALGTFGVMLIVVSYFLLQVGRVASEDPLYSWLNLIGAIMILISLMYNFNFASFVIEIFWILISLVGLWRAARDRLAAKED